MSEVIWASEEHRRRWGPLLDMDAKRMAKAESSESSAEPSGASSVKRREIKPSFVPENLRKPKGAICACGTSICSGVPGSEKGLCYECFTRRE